MSQQNDQNPKSGHTEKKAKENNILMIHHADFDQFLNVCLYIFKEH